jgi:antirestriction protein ArdC
VVYWSIREINELGEEGSCISKRVPLIRYSIVFNLSQTNLYNPDADIGLTILDCEDIVNRMPHKPIIKHNISRCYYSIDEDYISLPQISDFDIPSEFYSSLFHELIHWTGHPNRLNRFKMNDMQSEYSFEELIAEIGSAYLCAQAGISAKVLSNQSSYIDHWLKHLRNDKDIFIKAAQAAQKANMYILNHSIASSCD